MRLIFTFFVSNIPLANIADIKKYSVVHIIDRLHTGGAERVLVTLANIFYQHGHAVTVITLVEQGPLAEQLLPGIHQINLGRQQKLNPITMYRLVQAIKNIDIVHVHSSFNMRYVFLAGKLFNLQKPIFFHEHFGDIDIDTSVKWHQRYIYPKTIMICVSRRIAEWALQHLPVDARNVFVLHNIVVKKESVPKRMVQDNGYTKLVIVSNIRRTKNIEFAIELLNRLKKSDPCSLTIIGKKVDTAYYDELTALIEKHQLQNSVHILDGVDEVQTLLHEFDIAVHTAKSESGPLVLIEYLAQNLPFVTFNTGETVLQVKDELLGYVAQSFDVKEWVDKIEQILLQERETTEQLLQRIFEKQFSTEAYYQQCLKIYSAHATTPSAP